MGHKIGPIWNLLAYHGLPENRLKAAVLHPKYCAPKYLAPGSSVREELAKAVLHGETSEKR